MADQLKIGFIGLGSLGAPIARNLLEKGHQLLVYNRTASRAASFSSLGGRVCQSVAELAKDSSIVFSIVSDDAAIKSVVESEDGLATHLSKKSIHISMSTILPKTAAELAAIHEEKGQIYIAAPVFGRPEAAVQKKLNFVLSGEVQSKKTIEPLLRDAGAAGIWDFGDSISAANIVKLCGNFMIGSAIEAMGESISLAKQSGVDAQKMWDMFTATLFSSPVYVNYGKIILQEKFEPAAFTAKLGLKDVNLVLDQAESVHQEMPLARLLMGNLTELVRTGRDQLDWSAIFTAAQKN